MRHLGAPFGLQKTDGLHPNVTDMHAEGCLATYRAWARGETDMLCTNGVTNATTKDGFPFEGSACAASDAFMIPQANPIVQGPIPADYEPYPLGEQVIHYDCGDENCTVVANATYASEIREYLEESEFGKLENGDPVPLLIAKFGTFLHMLADRTSHYWCTDSERTGWYPVPDQDGNFTAQMDTRACNAVTHAMQHYWEQGVDSPLAPQSWAAISLFYDELLAFRDQVKDARQLFFNASFSTVPKETLIGTEAAPGTLASALMERNVTRRVGELNRLVVEMGAGQKPGWESDCNGKPW